MSIRIVEEPVADRATLAKYGTVPIRFFVSSRFAVSPVNNGLGGLLFVEEALTTPYYKDYDAFDGEGPTRWLDNFDLSRWGIFTAHDGEERIGGATIAWNTPGVDMLESRTDLAVLWDLRVHPDYRGRSIGHRLFVAAEVWARERGCRELKIETQNNNVSACKFYARQGCELRSIVQGAYPELPDEIQLLWYKKL